MTTAIFPPLSVGELLKRHRYPAGRTLAQLAERAGYTAVHISLLERGQRVPITPTIE
jgi:transcriptional regulator with XRE-family HTH domain